VRGGDRVTVLVPHCAGLAAGWDDGGVEVRSFRYAPERGELLGYGRSLLAASGSHDSLYALDLSTAVPEVARLFERLALRGEPLGPHATRLLRLLDDSGAAELAAAGRVALARATRSAGTRRGGRGGPRPRAAAAGAGPAAPAARGAPG